MIRSNVKIDYKKELENASKGMIMIHNPNTLIRLMVRMIIRKLGIKHAAMILFDPEKDNYVLKISRGVSGVKIPTGFTRFEKSSPLIKIFIEKKYRNLILHRNAIVSNDINKMIWRESVLENGKGVQIMEILAEVEKQMNMLNSEACVPAYYQDNLLAILLLGEKFDGTKFEQKELDFFSALANDAAMGIRNAQLFDQLKNEAERNHKLFLQTINVLGSTIEAKDAYTHGHTERVTQYAVAIAEQMNRNGSAKFEKKYFEKLYISGLLHDIGKIGVPESILLKEGKLTDEEYETMKQHAAKGAEIVEPLKLAKETVEGIKHHHESYNGKGYPDGLKGEEIPVTAAILAVADAFDAMTTNRPYRKSLTKEEAILEIDECTGSQFCPDPAKAFLELYDKGMI